MRLIDEEYTRRPFYGSRKMRDYLCRLGYGVNRKRVQRLMRLMGLQSVAPKPNTSQAVKQHKVYPYLLKGMTIDRPNQVVHRHHVHPSGKRVRLSRGRYGLVQSQGAFVGSVDKHGRQLCISALERALRLYPKPEILIQTREPSLPKRLYRRAKEKWNSHQHGWKRACDG